MFSYTIKTKRKRWNIKDNNLNYTYVLIKTHNLIYTQTFIFANNFISGKLWNNPDMNDLKH